jgi:Fe-S cluster assembly iron-binding protein IscA
MLLALTENDLTLTTPAQAKMGELFEQVDETVQGVRVFATPGGCSGVSFGMTFADAINGNDMDRQDAEDAMNGNDMDCQGSPGHCVLGLGVCLGIPHRL